MASVSAMIGALYAGHLLSLGRRKTLWITVGIIALYGVMTQYMNYWMILGSRFVFGFASGIKTVGVNRYIEEFVPLAIYPIASATNGLIGQLGTFLALFSAVVLPSDKIPKEL
jgi:MFS family permease